MSLVWREHSLENPAVNQRCGEPLEALVTEIGRDLNPAGDCGCSLEEIVRRVCRAFKLKPPITGEKIRTFLETANIYHEVVPNAGDTTFLYNQFMCRWEIHTRPCATYEWSRELWHEVWEILFWRCFHRIRWWKDWAVGQGYDKPHDKADEFAFLLLLSPQSVPTQAKKRQYDVYEVAKYYSIPTNLAFRALQSYTRFPHPILMVVLRLGVPPPVPRQPSLEDGLFADDEVPTDAVYARVYQKANKKGLSWGDVAALPHGEWQQDFRAVERSFETLSKHFRKDNILRIAAQDPMYCYCRQENPRSWPVQHVFGVDLPKEVCVITRQSPRCSDEIFLQVVPCGHQDAFLPGDNHLGNLPEVARHMMESEWRQTAKRIRKTGVLTSRR